VVQILQAKLLVVLIAVEPLTWVGTGNEYLVIIIIGQILMLWNGWKDHAERVYVCVPSSKLFQNTFLLHFLKTACIL
jgi:hypothetical protein